MAHYAKVINDKVVEVKTADENFFSNFVDTSPGTWIETFVDGSQLTSLQLFPLDAKPIGGS